MITAVGLERGDDRRSPAIARSSFRTFPRLVARSAHEQHQEHQHEKNAENHESYSQNYLGKQTPRPNYYTRSFHRRVVRSGCVYMLGRSCTRCS